MRENIRAVAGAGPSGHVGEAELLVEGPKAHGERGQGQGGGDLRVGGVRQAAVPLESQVLVELHGSGRRRDQGHGDRRLRADSGVEIRVSGVGNPEKP